MTKILLVEDDKSLREIYGVRLLAEGYDIVSAGDGEEALAMAIKDRPDLILSDVMMPKISGFDMLDILRSTTETKDIRVIMMTALSSEEQRQRGVALGADRYLVKSQVGIEDVVRTVHEVLTDAPVSSPSTSVPTAQPQAAAPTTPAPPVAPTQPQPMSVAPQQPQPVAQHGAVTMPAAVTPPAPAPSPVVSQPQPIAPQPVMAPTPVSALPPSSLPAPSAPLDPPTQKQTLASRVIEPLPSSTASAPDFSNMMSQELSGPAVQPQTTVPTPLSVSPSPLVESAAPVDTTPLAAPSPVPDLRFEETPLPQAPQPPVPPVPVAPSALGQA